MKFPFSNGYIVVNSGTQVSILLAHALQSFKQAADYGERFRLYREYIEGLPCTHRAEFYEGLFERLLGANETLSGIAAIHKTYLDSLIEYNGKNVSYNCLSWHFLAPYHVYQIARA